ncbi:MAG: hypothetical protein ACPG31_05315 [Planctomycetota bacterium]
MSRIVAACLLLLSLGFASCSSATSASELGIDPSIDTSPFNPHPRGISSWFGEDSDGPYASEEEDRGFLSIFFGTGESFGDSTARDWRPAADLYPRSDAHRTAHKMLLNEDFSDPYVQ